LKAKGTELYELEQDYLTRKAQLIGERDYLQHLERQTAQPESFDSIHYALEEFLLSKKKAIDQKTTQNRDEGRRLSGLDSQPSSILRRDEDDEDDEDEDEGDDDKKGRDEDVEEVEDSETDAQSGSPAAIAMTGKKRPLELKPSSSSSSSSSSSAPSRPEKKLRKF
jgi:hypothetical protein